MKLIRTLRFLDSMKFLAYLIAVVAKNNVIYCANMMLLYVSQKIQYLINVYL